MKERLRQVSRLFRCSVRYLLFLEILLKVIGAVILFPVCEMLLHVALRFTNVYYIATQNYKEALSQPLLLIVLILIILLFILFIGFEVSCLTLSYQQAYFREPVGYFQLLQEAVKKTKQLCKPGNWILIPFLCFLFPTLLYFIQNSSNNYMVVMSNVMKDIFSRFPWNVILIVISVLIFSIAIISMFAYQFYVTRNMAGFRAVKASLRLLKDHWKHVMIGLILWLVLFGIFMLVANLLVYGLIWVATRIFVAQPIRHAVTLTFYHYAKILLTFMNYSLSSFAGYAYVASSYYRYTKRHVQLGAQHLIQPLTKKKSPDARKKGSITVGMLGALLLVTFIVNLLLMHSVNHNALGDAFFSEKVAVLAHRGSTDHYTENTLGAFQEAMDSQADFIELDCQLTADGVVVVNHDVSLKRCWGVSKNIGNMTFEELQNITDKDGQHIPALSEVFELCQDSRINFNIEMKVSASSPSQQLAQAVMQVVQDYEMESRCIVQSFDYESLKVIKSIDDTMVCGYILNGFIGMYYDLEYADFFSLNMAYVNERSVLTAHYRDKKILVWTVNSQERMEEALAMGVDGIITDHPIAAREVIYGLNLPIENLLAETDSEPEE